MFQPKNRIVVDTDGVRRICPNPKWVTTKWVRNADEPFRKSAAELNRFDVFAGFDREGRWIGVAKHEFTLWRLDCQDPVKLFRATGYLGVANELNPKWRLTKEFRTMRDHLNEGWEILRNPPKSYEFVRMGYRMNGGDGDCHRFGNLAAELLKRNPLDRHIARAAVGELGWERMGKFKNDSKFESLVIGALERVKKTPLWRPWDGAKLAWATFQKARRTNKRSDLNQAIQIQLATIKVVPNEMDKPSFVKDLEIMERAKEFISQ